MNNKTVIEFGFRIIWRIMEISEGVMPIKPLSISTVLEMIRKPNSIIVKYYHAFRKNWGIKLSLKFLSDSNILTRLLADGMKPQWLSALPLFALTLPWYESHNEACWSFTLYFIIKIKAKDQFIKESSCYCFLLALVLSSQLTETKSVFIHCFN